jgi:hypothetical protein
MKLYLISQTDNIGYDTHDSAVVAARDPTQAAQIHPYGEGYEWNGNSWGGKTDYTWARKPASVTVEIIGTAKPGTKPGVIIASFNAG